jgi:hypothetical protein
MLDLSGRCIERAIFPTDKSLQSLNVTVVKSVGSLLSNIKNGNTRTCATGCKFDPRRIGVLASQRSVYSAYARGCVSQGRVFVPLSFERWLQVVALPCIYCGAAPRVQGIKGRKDFPASGVDHFDPTIKRPSGNSVPSCLPCNHEKSDMTPKEWETRLAKTRGEDEAKKIIRFTRLYLKKQRLSFEVS